MPLMEANEPKPAPVDAPVATPAKPQTSLPRKRGWLRIALGVVVVLAVLFFGVPWVIRSFNTVSTDDAYVNSYVTFVASRVSGQVARVLVDDNNRVKKGEVLV